MSICFRCKTESKFGRYSIDKSTGEKQFECNSCLNKVEEEAKLMLTNKKQSAGQIIKAKAKERTTFKYKVKKFFGLVKEDTNKLA